MPQVLIREKGLLRINPKNRLHIEFSTDRGSSWSRRFTSYDTVSGYFYELLDYGSQMVVARTSKGSWYSDSEGSKWTELYGSASIRGKPPGTFGIPQVLAREKELLRINPKNPHLIEYSTDGGICWESRYCGSGCGEFYSLKSDVNGIIAQTSEGVFHSYAGVSWSKSSGSKSASNASGKRSSSGNASGKRRASGSGTKQSRGLVLDTLIWLFTHPPTGWIILAALIIGMCSLAR